VTAAGVAAFPSLTNQLVEACWHGYFTGDTGTLVPLVDYPYPSPSDPRVAVSIGGASITLPSAFALSLPSAPVQVGAAATFTATVKDGSLNPIVGATVTFSVTSGPNQGFTQQATTDSTGAASVTLTGAAVGTDEVTASAEISGVTKTASGTVDWIRFPSSPTITVNGGETSLVVTATPAAGDTDLTEIELTLQPGNVVVTVPGSGGTYTFTGLENGSEYVVQAIARNASGDSVPVTQRGTPGHVAPPAAAIDMALTAEPHRPVAGSTVHVSAVGLLPGSEVRVSLDPAPGLLSVLTADADGKVDAQVQVPDSLGSGQYQLTARGTRADGEAAASSSNFLVDWSGAVAGTPVPAGYTGITPIRLVDTREGAALAAGSTSTLEIPEDVVPDGVTAVALNVTAVDPSADGYLTVFPCVADAPVAAALNYAAGTTASNLVLAAADGGDSVCIFTSAATHLVVDLNGYHETDSTDAMVPTNPVRLVDTRQTTALVAGQTLEVAVLGDGKADDASTAVSLHVTATDPASAGFLTVFPCGSVRPLASNLNYLPGETVGNEVFAKVGDEGQVCIYSMSATHVVVDLDGWYVDRPSQGRYRPLVPGRLLDTRAGVGLEAGATAELTLTGPDALPVGSRAVSLNVAVSDPDRAGFLTVYPCASGRPLASNLNFTPGQTVSSHVTVGIDDAGKVCVYSSAATDLVVDVEGYYGSGA
jgi:hypothetical protein